MLAGLFNIAVAVINKTYIDRYASALNSAIAATSRQLAVERSVHAVSQLLLVNEGIINATDIDLNATLAELQSSGEREG